MFSIDDPMFALILRFVGQYKKIDYCHHDFIQEQLQTIKDYVAPFPPQEQEFRAIEWIEQYAKEYRKQWLKNLLNKEFTPERCADCPLINMDSQEHCQIHDRWLQLLTEYAAEEIESHQYIEKTLDLLAEHKENLRIKLSKIT